MPKLNNLKKIDNPARYTGGEARQIIKNANLINNRVCIAVPIMYEMGMFDFDYKAIYYILNRRRDTWCERCFAPMKDFEILLKNNEEKLYTLESKTPLRDMDIVIFSLSNEMLYTNMLNMMNLGGIPILKDRRKNGFPIIIACGTAITNPKPLEDFVDMYIIGEPTVVIEDIMNSYMSAKSGFSVSKQDILLSMKDVPGVYIPELYDEEDIHMVIEADMDSEIVPKNVVIPSISTMGDGALVTLSKGCDRGCTMCPHKYAYGKAQYLSLNKAITKTKNIISSTGHTNVVLMSNCYADYPEHVDLINKIKDMDKPKVRDVSFMEVKLNKDNLWLLKELKNKEDYPSIIVGGATCETRNALGIDITEEDVLEISKKVFEAGFNKIRLKYIIGVPMENYEDFSKMLDLANKVCKVYKEVYVKSPDRYIVELNIYHFEVKPHTPTQWCAVNTAENLEIKTKYIMDKNKNDMVIITTPNFNQTVISTMLARGDKEVGQVIYEAWKQGARFDIFPNLFNKEHWQIAMQKVGVELKKYLEEKNEKVVLPWDFITLGTPKEIIKREYINKLRSRK